MRKFLFVMAALMMMLFIAAPVFAEEREGYPYEVGDKVWAKVEDTEEGKTLFFYSEGGTLSKDWKDKIPTEDVKVIRFAPGSDKMYLPKDSSRLFAYLNIHVIHLDKVDTSKVTNMGGMFSYCTSLKELDVSNFDTSKVTDMCGMFKRCSKLVSLNVRDFNTSKVTDMNDMFYLCENLTNLDVSNFDTSKVTNMNSMFYYCSSLKRLKVRNFNTLNVISMGSMFCGCSGLTNLDVSSFDTSNVTNADRMFSGCTGLTSLDLGNFVLSKCKRTTGPFSGCDNMLSDCDALEMLVTPTIGKWKVYPLLPFTMSDASGNIYDFFPANSITLTRYKKRPPTLKVANISTKANTTKDRSTTLKVIYDGDDVALSFASSNPMIKVDYQGKVTIPKNFAGTAIITVKSLETLYYLEAEAKAKITVSSLENTIVAEDVIMSAAAKAQTFTLYVTQQGTGKLTFSSNITSVKVTSGGKVTVAKNFSGRAKITIKTAASGVYKAVKKTISVIVKPAKVTSGTAKNSAAGKIALAWKQAAGAEGYQIQYSLSKDFKTKKSVTTKNLKATLSKLTKGKNYFVRIRSYKKDADGNLFSAWTSFKAVKVTK